MIAEFATIVGLIVQYRSERGNQAQLEYHDFMEWLANANHTEVKDLLDLNVNATISIKTLLNQDHKIFNEKLDKIDTALTAFVSTLEGFSSLAQAINPNNTLSEQAINILKQFQKSGASQMLEHRALDDLEYLFLGVGSYLEISEQRFVEDDLQILIKYGLLRQDFNSSGKNLYTFTRAASNLVGNESS